MYCDPPTAQKPAIRADKAELPANKSMKNRDNAILNVLTLCATNLLTLRNNPSSTPWKYYRHFCATSRRHLTDSKTIKTKYISLGEYFSGLFQWDWRFVRSLNTFPFVKKHTWPCTPCPSCVVIRNDVMYVIVWLRSTKWEYNADLGARPPPKTGVASRSFRSCPKQFVCAQFGRVRELSWKQPLWSLCSQTLPHAQFERVLRC